MQLTAINRSLVPQTTAVARKRPQTRSETRARHGNADDFTPLLSSFGDVIEAEFEDMGDAAAHASSSKQNYFDVLFPEFLLKSRYVNYYV
jgi:hypothetical protein